jgi:hypothetical protein
MMNRYLIASVFVFTSALVVQPAMADYDTVGSALVGGVAGAVIGQAVGGRNGAAVGAAIGGVGGVVLSENKHRYYERAPVVYRQPAPVSYYQGYSEYQPVREVAYPVRQVVYYDHEDRGYNHDWHHGWDHDWHHGWDHGWHGDENDHGGHHGWDHDGHDHHDWNHDDDE